MKPEIQTINNQKYIVTRVHSIPLIKEIRNLWTSNYQLVQHKGSLYQVLRTIDHTFDNDGRGQSDWCVYKLDPYWQQIKVK